MESKTIAELLGPSPDASPEAVDARVAATLAALGCDRPPPGADPDDPRVGLWWLLRMAARTHRHAREASGRADPSIDARPAEHPAEHPAARSAAPPSAPPPAVDRALLARFEARLSRRPTRAEAHGQLHVDAPSTLRRAAAIAGVLEPGPGPVVAVGDDDAVTLALDLMGLEEVHAVDIDPRVLAFLREASGGRVRTHEADVLGGPVPAPLRGRCAAAVTDPFRDLDGGLGFLTFAAACLRRDAASRLLWVDHPDWNFEHAVVREALERLGWRVEGTLEDLHAYPLSAEAVGLDALQRAWREALDPAWLAAVARQTRAFSHLHVLRRA